MGFGFEFKYFFRFIGRFIDKYFLFVSVSGSHFRVPGACGKGLKSSYDLFFFIITFFKLMFTNSCYIIFLSVTGVRLIKFIPIIRTKRGRRPSGARNWVGIKKKSKKKKKGTTTTTTTTNFVPGQTMHFLVEVFTFLSIFQPSKTFSYVFHFHNLSKRHSEKKTFDFFFLCPKPTQHLFLSILL